MAVTNQPPIHLDPAIPGFVADPYPHLAHLREAAPFHWSPPLRAWVATRYPDVHAILADHSLSADTVTPFYKAQPTKAQAELGQLMRYLGNWLVFKDPPDHTRMRNLVARVFTSRALQPVRTNVERITADLLDKLEPGQTIDLVAEFSNPLPAYVIMDMLGVSRSLLPEMKHWSDEIKLFIGAAQAVPDKYSRASVAVTAMAEAFRHAIDNHRQHPKDDILSLLISAHDDQEDRLTDDELVASCILFLFAGHETTTNFISMATLHLMAHPEQRAAFCKMSVVEDIEAATEELLRFDGPAPAMVRVAMSDHTIAGHSIRSGERIYAMIASANRDPEAFDEPDHLDIARAPKRHYGFGYGLHFCLGAPLARLEAAIALPALHRRFPDMTLAGTPDWTDGMTLRGPVNLPVHLGNSMTG